MSGYTGAVKPLQSRWKLKPTLGRVTVQAILTEEKTEGGIFIPGGREESGQVMRVVEICDPYWSAQDDKDGSPSGPQFKKGDIILVGKFMGVDVEIGREKYIVIRESEVLSTFIEVLSDAADQAPEQPTPRLPASTDSPERAGGFVDPIATGLADGVRES